MGSNLVIVAIPNEDDRVWKMSSEKVPHLTVLFLGDSDEVSNVEEIVKFVDHAAKMSLNRFYLPVDRRDELGEDKADVLFFKKGRYDYKAIREFRSQLLQDNNIKSAYDATSQFERAERVGAPGHPWIPHLTLGYPASPAKPEKDDYGRIYEVCFNKIAVWIDDYEGPEFLLKDCYDEWDALETVPMDVYMSDIQHYGTKGMRWGVRKEREENKGMWDPEGHDLGSDIFKTVVWPLVPPLGVFSIPAQVRLTRGAARGVKAKTIDAQEKRFEKKAASAKNFVAIHNGAGERINRELDGINKKYSDTDMGNPTKKKQYDDEVLKLMQDSYKESANSLTNKRNTQHLDAEFTGDGMDVKITAKQGPGTPMPQRVRHADDDAEETFTFHAKFKRDTGGRIVGMEFEDFESPKMSMAQTMELGAEFLAHYGTKGMRWGVRRSEPSAVVPSGASKVPHGKKRKTKVEVEGGENHPAAADAVKVAEHRAKLKKSGAAALTNSELREVAQRMQLEQQVKQLTTSGGRKFVTGFLKNQGQQQTQNLLNEQVRNIKKGRAATA